MTPCSVNIFLFSVSTYKVNNNGPQKKKKKNSPFHIINVGDYKLEIRKSLSVTGIIRSYSI